MISPAEAVVLKLARSLRALPPERRKAVVESLVATQSTAVGRAAVAATARAVDGSQADVLVAVAAWEDALAVAVTTPATAMSAGGAVLAAEAQEFLVDHDGAS